MVRGSRTRAANKRRFLKTLPGLFDEPAGLCVV